MARRNKTRQVGIKVEPALAEFLEALPNRSEFIRQAILAMLREICPLCSGCGVVPSGINTHFQEILTAHTEVGCRKCRRRDPIQFAAPEGNEEARWVRFLSGNGYYCEQCFPDAPPVVSEITPPS